MKLNQCSYAEEQKDLGAKKVGMVDLKLNARACITVNKMSTNPLQVNLYIYPTIINLHSMNANQIQRQAKKIVELLN